MGAALTVVVPGPDYRATGEMAEVWDATGTLITDALEYAGSGPAWSAILSRVSRELRREIGVEATKQAFTDLAATVGEAAQYDE